MSFIVSNTPPAPTMPRRPWYNPETGKLYEFLANGLWAEIPPPSKVDWTMRTAAYGHEERQALMLSVRMLRPCPGSFWELDFINFLTEYHLSLDLNQPAAERTVHREAAFTLAHRLIYGSFAAPS